MTEQLTLFAPPPIQAPTIEPWKEAMFAKVRAEGQAFLAVANELFPGRGWKTCVDIATKDIRTIRSEYNRRNGLPPPWWDCPDVEPTPFLGTAASYKPKPYRPHSLERKQRRHLKDMVTRIHKKYSFPDMWIPLIQEKLLTNPRYYGVCPLPGAIDASPVEFPSEAQLQAIELENQLRDIESGRAQPIKLPLSLKEPVRELVLNGLEVTR